MEEYRVIGFMPVDFKDSRTGSVIKGTSVYCTSALPAAGTGLKAEKFFFKSDIDCSDLAVDMDINIFFNRYGKVSGFHIL